MKQIDLIIDALEVASHVPKGVVYPAGYPMQIAQALAAARELRALKPAPRKEWVGLTDEEITKIMQRWRNGYIDIKDVEQLLKELNT